ncbi:uncharacterized protein A1O9_11235 [Exophiala aquamarina CBS 119918]|uniref:Nephrocystin 3-like N-terminal domain-containing protein n=1 Tax=Exophiala aquamarina CBS 119918 TaxID=1182545 RepID=A0A072P0P7_9EURO|nr:uncharacterized protein A1O9_11235 [Exophiala aquamarina CBS 119918]KEF52818.1 hypothetical protein A1O9_11235 [Exophiala aquamarina CBS 119918]
MDSSYYHHGPISGGLVSNGGTQNFHDRVFFGPGEVVEDEYTISRLFCRIDYDAFQEKVKDPHTGTCKWFTERKAYGAASTTVPSLLCLIGSPGAGKTVLAKHLVTTSNSKTIYFFCDGKNREYNTAISILLSLIHQCVMMEARCGEQVNAMYRRWHSVLSTSYGRLGDLFGMIMSTSDPDKNESTWSCIIDGLDHCEAPEREKLLHVFAKGFEVDNSAWNLRLLIFSRPCEEIKTKIQTWENTRIQTFTDEAGSISNQSDIAKYIDDKVSMFQHYTLEEQTKTIENLKSTVKGSFEYCVRIIEALKHSSPDYAYKLSDIPLPSMDEMLEDVLDRTNPKQIALLQMLAILERAPSVEAFNAISQIRDGPFSEFFDFGGKADTIDHILLCEAALRVSNGNMHFAHPTMKEYIRKQMTESEVQQIHGKVAQTCLLYLATVGLETHSIAGSLLGECADEYMALLKASPFLDYAANFWHYHFENAGQDPMGLWHSIHQAFSIQTVRDLAFRVYRFQEQDDYIGGQSLLHILVHYSLVSLTKRVLSAKEIFEITLDDRDNRGRTALWWAVDAKNESFVRLLLETEGVSHDDRDEDNISPAVLAITLGHTEILRLFLESGRIDWAQKDKTGRTFLVWAAKTGNPHVVAELLGIDACVNTMEEKCPDQTALVLAARHGFKDVVKLLLEKNADPNSLDTESGRSALSWAAGSGHEGVVAVLLENQVVELSQRDAKYGNTAFHWAADRQRREIARMILDTTLNRDQSLAYDKARSLLFEASKKGQAVVLDILLENESLQIDPDCMLEGRTPLSFAAEHGHHQVVSRLISSGKVDLNSSDSGGMTPLIHASRGDASKVVKALLKEDVNLQAKDFSGLTAKDWAEILSRAKILKLIKDAEKLQRNSTNATT